MRLLAAVVPLPPERHEQVKATVAELDPMLERSKSAPVIKWAAEAVPAINRLIRESLKSDESIVGTIDGVLTFVLENIADGEQQEEAVNAIARLEALHRKGQLAAAAENRAEKIDELLAAILTAMESASCGGAVETSKSCLIGPGPGLANLPPHLVRKAKRLHLSGASKPQNRDWNSEREGNTNSG